MVVPGPDRGINKATKKEQETDEQNNAGHAIIETVSSLHSRNLCHAGVLEVGPAVRATGLFSHTEPLRSIIHHVKTA